MHFKYFRIHKKKNMRIINEKKSSFYCVFLGSGDKKTWKIDNWKKLIKKFGLVLVLNI